MNIHVRLSNLVAALLVTACLAAAPVAADTAAPADGWAAVPAILARIKPPTFPARDFPITEHGAPAGWRRCSPRRRRPRRAR